MKFPLILLYFWLFIYNLVIFTNSFLYSGVEVGAIVTGIIIVDIVARRGRNSRLRGGVG